MTNLISASSDNLKIVDRFPHQVKELLAFNIPLSDGTLIAARAWMPVDAEANPVPAIIEYIPYRQRDFTAPRDAVIHPYFAGYGYAAVRVDIRGSGDSGGTPLDEYVQQEQDDALEILAWISQQIWCSGETGMIGISWGGFNGLQVAALRPPSLKAVITVCSTDDRYHDDVHYMGGCLLSNNTTWGSTMWAYSFRPPDPEVVGEQWKSMWKHRIESAPAALITWLQHPFRDDYWKHGSVCENFADIQSAVYAVGGWTDGYTNSIPRLLAGLSCPRRGLIGPWAHGYPHIGVPGPGIGFLQDAVRWWDRWLKGRSTEIDHEPMLQAWMQLPRDPEAYSDQIGGNWITRPNWPQIPDSEQQYFLNVEGLQEMRGPSCEFEINSPLITGITSGEWCPHGMGPELATDQVLDDAGSLVFDSAPLESPLAILGAPLLRVKLASDKKQATLAVRLSVLLADGRSSRVSYGVLNLSHRDGHESPVALEPGKYYSIVIKLNDTAQYFPAGCRIRVALSSCLWPLTWPAPEQASLKICNHESSLTLPLCSDFEPGFDAVAAPFEPAEMPTPKPLRWLRPVSRERKLTTDAKTGKTCLTYIKDDGAYYLDDVDMEVDAWGSEQHCINSNDPLSATQTAIWKIEHRRRDWVARVETQVKLSCSDTHFHVEMECRAYEGDRLFAERIESESLPRRFL